MAKKLTAAQIAAAKAKAAAAKKEAAYIASLGKTTSPSSSGLYTYGERIDMSGGSAPYNPAMASSMNPTMSPGASPIFGDPNASPTAIPVTGASTSATTKEISDATRDAFAALADLFASYGLESLADEITSYMTSGKTAGEALIALKTNPNGAYAKRFAGNFARTKNGLNALSEAEYITNEKAYAETLKAYGLGNMLSVNREDNYKKFADYIAGDVSPDEFKDRVKTVVMRVQNADPSIKATLKSFYPEISDNDLVSYFLNPKENLPRLQEKVTASEIGAAFTGQGLSTNVTSATDLAKYGIDRAGALVGTQQIKEVLPVSEKLSSIYGEAGIKYDQTASESEFFKGNQDAAQQRKRLKSMERAAFSGSSGVGQSSLTKSIQGLL
jgi:hypothetical protein